MEERIVDLEDKVEEMLSQKKIKHKKKRLQGYNIQKNVGYYEKTKSMTYRRNLRKP